ncbi:MAG: transporter substrate-binding domain-containing protein [Bacteriovoracaceae bacterium]
MKTSVFWLLFFFPVFAGAEVDADADVEAEVEVVAFHYPPLIIAGHEQKGMIPELLKAAMKEMNMTLKLKLLPPKRAFKEFYEKDVLILSTFRILKSEKFRMLPVTKVHGAFFGTNKHSKIQRVAYNRGFTLLEKIIKAKSHEPFPVPHVKAAIKALEADRAQRIFASNLNLNYVMQHNFKELSKKLRMIEGPFYSDAAGLVGKKSQKETLLKIQKGLDKIRQKGRYQMVAKKYLDPYLGKFSLNDFLYQKLDLIKQEEAANAF